MEDEKENDVKRPYITGVCSVCGKTKVREPAGFFPNGRDRRFTDAAGKQWNGKTCASCQRAKARNHQKVKRNKDIQ